jgi:biopolymer transport protein ExbD
MNKFKRNSSTSEEISTASLPDIVFMLLFFFMVATVVRPHDLLVEQNLPRATQLKKIEKKSLVSYIHVGNPKNREQFGFEPRIQFNDVFINTEQIPQGIEEERTKLSEVEKDKLMVALKVDNAVKMGIINDVETQLKEVNALKIIYNTLKEE